MPLWLPVMFGAGIALWFVLSDPRGWIGVMLFGTGLGLAGWAIRRERRLGRVLIWSGCVLALGCGLAWWRAGHVAAPVLAKAMVVALEGKVKDVDLQLAKGKVRLLILPQGQTELPPLVRVTAEVAELPVAPQAGALVQVRARLVPPPGAAVPGGYDFSRAAWFQGLGAVGTAIGPVKIIRQAEGQAGGLRDRLSAHIRAQMAGSAGGIGAALASGDRGGISAEDEEAMRASGLTHLLSVSGLHITAVVAAVMFLAMRLLALSPRIALRLPVPLIAAGFAALAGIGYTLLTGAEVPTIRSCVAALLVLAGIAILREAMTLRLVATGALVVLLLWPESLVGASFQLSFAAITSIVALHENRRIAAFLARREEGALARLARGIVGLLLTGLVVEVALAPIALYHFHRQGLYGAMANLVAIPLTTFVIMPLEALALAFDGVGLGAPFWWLTGKALALLLWIAREVAALPGAVAMVPSVPTGALALMLGGGFWLLLWKSRARLFGLAPLIIGSMWIATLPPPDLLVTGDGMHLAVRGEDGSMALLRPRAGDFVRQVLAERGGIDSELLDLDVVPEATCGRDMCLVSVHRGGRQWRIAATRSDYRLPWTELTTTCASADIIISSRRLPKGCAARWLKADWRFLASTGGMAISLGEPPKVETVNRAGDRHPWAPRRLLEPSAWRTPEPLEGRAEPLRVPSQRPRPSPE